MSNGVKIACIVGGTIVGLAVVQRLAAYMIMRSLLKNTAEE